MLYLRDTTEGDLPSLYVQQIIPEANAMAAVGARDQAAFFEHWRTKVLGRDSVVKKTILSDDRIVGHLVCWEQENRHLVGYWIDKNHWGKGIATEALKEFIRQLKLRPLYAYVAEHNSGSRRVLEKCGFAFFQSSTLFSKAHNKEIPELLMILK